MGGGPKTPTGFVQDGPPPGGFPAIRYARKIPSTGPSGATMFGVGLLVMGYGLYKVVTSNRARNVLQKEKEDARWSILPFLQAEEDFRFIKAESDFHKFEAEVMKDVPGWEVGKNPYKTRWMPPSKGLIIDFDDPEPC